METTELISKLMNMPKRIAAVQVSILDKAEESQKITQEIIRCETKLKVLISGLTDENGKKLHSNEDARRAAFAEMSEDDIELNELKKNSAKIEHDLQEERINFDALTNEQKNIRAILMFLSSNSQ
jgi:hypothetical protein